MGFFAMIASMLLGILFVAIGISRRKQKGWPIILIALGIVLVLIWEVIKRLAATSSTGISPPHGSHAAALIACDGFTLENAITLGL